MNTPNKNTNDDTRAELRIPSFIWKLLVTSVVVVFVYQLTIASAVRKAESVIAKIDKVASLVASEGNFQAYIAKLAKRSSKISGEEKAALRHDTRQLLENFAPVLDEIIFYYERKRQAAEKSPGA